jgi:signal transduction histidine kinase
VTLQLRLALLYVALALTTVVVLGAGAYLIAQDRIHANLDESLRANAMAVEAALGLFAGPLTVDKIQAARPALDQEVVQGTVFQIRAPDGSVLYSSAGTTAPLPLTEPGVPRQGLSTLSTPRGDERSLVRPLVRFGETVGYVESRTSLGPANASLSDIRTLLLIVGAIAATVTSGLAYYFAGRAVDPVRRLATLASDIERTADFSRRLPPARTTAEMDEMVRTFNRMIVRVERLVAAQRSFLSDTSHELRRPLTILRANIDIMNDPALDEAGRADVEREMRGAAESMSTLLSELLMLARSDERFVVAEQLDFSELCRTAVQHACQVFKQRAYEASIEPDVMLAGDAEGLTRLVDNLLQNATLYSGEDTAVSLFLSGSHEVRLRVVDHGVGMSEEDIGHAFERFYRARSARRARPEGLGLGLAIVKQVVDAHHGSIVIDSEPGQGTTVTVTLPR